MSEPSKEQLLRAWKACVAYKDWYGPSIVSPLNPVFQAIIDAVKPPSQLPSDGELMNIGVPSDRAVRNRRAIYAEALVLAGQVSDEHGNHKTANKLYDLAGEMKGR